MIYGGKFRAAIPIRRSYFDEWKLFNKLLGSKRVMSG